MNLCGNGALAMAAKRAQQHNNQKQESLERVLQTDICTLATLISILLHFYGINIIAVFSRGKDEQKLESNRDDKIFLSLSIVGLLWDILDWFYFLS